MQRKRESIPAESHETTRQRIMAALEGGPLSGRDISGSVGIPEKDVFDHLEHIRASLHRDRRGKQFIVLPAKCGHCGFQFEKRQRLKKPGKCPVCRKGPVSEPLFLILSR